MSNSGYLEVGEDALGLLKVRDVARRLAVSEPPVWRLIGSGQLRSLKIARSRRVVPEDLAAYIARLRRGAGA